MFLMLTQFLLISDVNIKKNVRYILSFFHTGGNAGIGKETAIDLARRGARIIIGCRNAKKAEVALREIQRRSGSSNVMYRHLELCDQESIRKFADIILKEEPKIYCLVNNAGMWLCYSHKG